MNRRCFLQTSLPLIVGGGFTGHAAAATLRANAVGACDDKAAAILAAAGYGYLELSFSNVVDPRQDDAWFAKQVEKIRAMPLPVEAMNGFLPSSGFRITGPDANPDAIVEWGKRGFTRAAMLGVKVLTFGSGGARKIPEGFDPAKARAQCSTLVGRLAPLAKAAGLVFAMENLNSGETNLGTTMEECLGIVEASGSLDAMLTVDIFHMLREKESPAILARASKRIVHSHVAENTKRAQPGHAGEDFRPYLRALAAVPYTGRFTFECGWQGGIEKSAAPAITAFRAQMD